MMIVIRNGARGEVECKITFSPDALAPRLEIVASEEPIRIVSWESIETGKHRATLSTYAARRDTRIDLPYIANFTAAEVTAFVIVGQDSISLTGVIAPRPVDLASYQDGIDIVDGSTRPRQCLCGRQGSYGGVNYSQQCPDRACRWNGYAGRQTLRPHYTLARKDRER